MRFYRRGRLNKDTYLLKDMHFTVECRYGLLYNHWKTGFRNRIFNVFLWDPMVKIDFSERPSKYFEINCTGRGNRIFTSFITWLYLSFAETSPSFRNGNKHLICLYTECIDYTNSIRNSEIVVSL